MALTPEDKKRIQARVKELELSGMGTQDAISKAFADIAGPQALSQTISERSKGTAAPLQAGAKPVNPNSEAQAKSLRNEYNKAKADFIKTRRDELKSLGYTDAVAESMASDEFNRSFRTPMESGFGDYAERKGELLIPPIKPEAVIPEIKKDLGLFDALRPQVFFSPGASKQEELSRFDTAVTGEKAEINWADVKEAMSDSGLKGQELDNYIEGLKAAYKIKKAERRSKQASGLEASKPGTPQEFAQKTLEETMAELANIANAPVITVPEEAAAKKREASGDLTAGDILAKQVEAGAEKRNYSPAQSAYIDAVRDTDRARAVKARLEAGETKKIWTLKDGTKISDKEYTARQADAVDTKKPDLALQGAAPSTVKLTRSEITADEARKFEGQAARDFTLSSEKLAEYNRDPAAFMEKYKESGILTDTSILGGQKETTLGQTLRIVLAPSNALAGAVSGVFEGFEALGGDPEFVAQEKRKSRPELYKDNPVLYNIAKNRGFLGEGVETAEILGLEGAAKGAYLAGTFAADMLDPTFEIMKGVGVGTKTGIGAYNASAALKAIDKASAAGRITEAAKVGAKAGLNDILDTIVFGKAGRMLDIPENIVEKIPVVGPKIKAGSKVTRDKLRKVAGLDDLADPRSLASTDLARSLDASTEASRRIALNPQATVEQIAEELAKSDKYKDSTYAKAFAKEAEKNSARSAADLAATIKRDEPLIQEAENIVKGIDELARTGSTRLVRNKEVARQLGNLASSDPDVAARFRAIDAAKPDGKTKLSRYVKALTPDQRKRLKRAMLHSEAATAVYKATKESKIPVGNLVAATKNVLVDKKLLPEIMKAAKESVVGRIADELRGSPISFKQAGTSKQVGRQIMQGYDLTKEQAKVLGDRIAELVNFRRIDANTAAQMSKNLNNDFITTKDLRSLIDNEVDQIAESAASAGKAVERSRDVARLPVQDQLKRLIPLEARSFTRSLLDDFIKRKTKDPSNLSVGQKALLKEAKQKMASLDVKLRTTMKDLVGTKPFKEGFLGDTSLISQGDKEVRDLYGIEGEITPQEGLAFAIAGPKEYRQGEEGIAALRDALEFGLSNLFYNKQTKENIFDLFSGTTISRDTGVFSQAGIEKYFKKEDKTALLQLAAKDIAENPRLLWDKLQEVSNAIRADLANPETRTKLFNNPDSVIDIVKQGEARSGKGLGKYGGLTGLKPGTIPPEVSLGIYYKAEADAINEGVLFDLINKEIGKGSLSPLASFDQDYIKYIGEVFLRNGIVFNGKGNFISLIHNRLKASLKDPNFKISDMSAEDVADVFLTKGSRLKSQAQREADDLIRAVEKETAEAIDKLKIKANLDRRLGMPPIIDRKKLEAITKRAEAKIKKIKEQAKSVDPSSERGKRLLGAGRPNDIAEAERLLANDEFRSVLNNLTEAANDVASGIKRRNGLSVEASISKVEDEINKITKALIESNVDDKASLRLLFGEDVKTQIIDNMNQGFNALKKELTNELVRNYENEGKLKTFLNGIRELYWWINDTRYTLLLTLRTKFHTVNLLTGGDIVLQTTGKLPNYADVAEGLLLSITSQRNPNKIILGEAPKKLGENASRLDKFKSDVGPFLKRRIGTGYEGDKLYRQYTAREVYDLLFEQGGKSTESLIPGLSTGRTLDIIRGDKPISTGFAKLKSTPQAEDMAYRYAVFADAIRSGRSEAEAVELARISMYDAGDLTAAEKAVQRNLLFYTWMRNNFVNFMKNTLSSEGRRRIVKSINTGRTAEALAPIAEEDKEWAPAYLKSKILLDKLTFGKKDVFITTPSLPTRDAISLFTQFLTGEISSTALQMLNPAIKTGLDLESSFDRTLDRVPAEHVAIAKLAADMSGASVEDVISAIVGSEITPRQARPDEGAVNGYVYPLTTPEQIRRYKYYTDAIQFGGAMTLINDLSKTLDGEGTAAQALKEQYGTPGSIAYGLGIINASGSIPPEKQDYYNKLGKIAAIKAGTNVLQKYERMPTEGETAPPTEALPPGKDPRLAGRIGSEARRGGTDIVALQERQQLLSSEITKLMTDLYTGRFPEYLVGGKVTAAERARFEEEKGVNAKKQEIVDITKEINAMKRAGKPAPKPAPAGKDKIERAPIERKPIKREQIKREPIKREPIKR
jgi:hypothetical protein